MEKVKIKDLSKGDLFCLKDYEEPTDMQIFVRDYYDRSDKRYYAYKWGDVNAFRTFKGEKEVYLI